MNTIAECERDDALRDVQIACSEYGMPIRVELRLESDVRRDLYGSVKGRSAETDEFEISALPFTNNPDRRELEKAGLREYADAMAYTSTKDWTDRGWTFATIDAERTTIVRGDIRYRIVEKNAHSQFLDAFLYVVLNLRRL